MMFNDENKLIAELNQYLSQGYEGYVQFSGCSIDKDCIFNRDNKTIPPKDGFIFEAHLSDAKKSITVRRINKEWYLDETTLPDELDEKDIKSYRGQHNTTIKMAQIWEPEEDKFCEDMEVLKLKKVVFAGFEATQGGKS